MLEAFSENLLVPSSSEVPLNQIVVSKGGSVSVQGTSSIVFNKCGVYEVNVYVNAIASTAGEISFVLMKDGVRQVPTSTSVTAADTTSLYPLSFSALVQVPKNNSSCPCQSPVTAYIFNEGVEVSVASINVIVLKVA